MPWRSASVFCSQRRTAGCGTRIGVGREQRLAGTGPRELVGEQAGEQFEVVAVVEAEVGARGHDA
jgi:hypothetical protein